MGRPCGVGRIAQCFRGREVVAQRLTFVGGARRRPLTFLVATVFAGRSRVGHVHVAYNTSHSGTWHFPSGISPPSDVPSVRVALAARLRRAEGVRNPLALGARNPSTGLKSKISGLFLRTYEPGWRWAPAEHRTPSGHSFSDANVCLLGTRRDTLDSVKYFAWDDAKNARLKAECGIGFEEIVFHIERGDLLDILEHPNRERFAGQRIFVVQREAYVYLVPFVEDEHTVFMKTIIPSRKATKENSVKRPTMKPDADETELLESVERGEWKSAGGKRERSRYARYAKATFRKDRRLNIRLSSKDLEAIQKRALAEGLPYQTLISSLLHKYASGRLKEV
jgi:predicted DNA binding CopG/RHH family protein